MNDSNDDVIRKYIIFVGLRRRVSICRYVGWLVKEREQQKDTMQ